MLFELSSYGISNSQLVSVVRTVGNGRVMCQFLSLPKTTDLVRVISFKEEYYSFRMCCFITFRGVDVAQSASVLLCTFAPIRSNDFLINDFLCT